MKATDLSGFLDDVLWVILVPPAMTIVWRLLARGWTNFLGTTGSQRVGGWVRLGTWVILASMYAISLSLLAYKYLKD